MKARAWIAMNILRKQLDNGNLRGRHDKDVKSQRGERDDNLKSRYGNMDGLLSKRRKEDEFLRREAEREEILYGHIEKTLVLHQSEKGMMVWIFVREMT